VCSLASVVVWLWNLVLIWSQSVVHCLLPDGVDGFIELLRLLEYDVAEQSVLSFDHLLLNSTQLIRDSPGRIRVRQGIVLDSWIHICRLHRFQLFILHLELAVWFVYVFAFYYNIQSIFLIEFLVLVIQFFIFTLIQQLLLNTSVVLLSNAASFWSFTDRLLDYFVGHLCMLLIRVSWRHWWAFVRGKPLQLAVAVLLDSDEALFALRKVQWARYQ